MKHIVVLSGAGISAESGLLTFRDMGGLWHNYRIEEVATPQAWQKNPELVLDFYNKRRTQLSEVEPNAGHKALVDLEKKYRVTVITQNVDDLHERAGSKDVLHLHGELSKVRSVNNEELIYDWGHKVLHLGDKAEDGAQLRPHIVWFGEAVPMIEPAIGLAKEADIILIVGTSLQVYPASSLYQYAPAHAEVYYVDPHADEYQDDNIIKINEKATVGVPPLVEKLLLEA